MTKEQLKIEFDSVKAELEEYKKADEQLARCFSAITSARASALEQKDGASDILSRLFLFDDCGECIGFNLDEVEYYCWLAADPRRKKAAPL